MKFFRWRQRKDEELNAEIQNHLTEVIRDRLARGETPESPPVRGQRCERPDTNAACRS